jgi:hypothetical protein
MIAEWAWTLILPAITFKVCLFNPGNALQCRCTEKEQFPPAFVSRSALLRDSERIAFIAHRFGELVHLIAKQITDRCTAEIRRRIRTDEEKITTNETFLRFRIPALCSPPGDYKSAENWIIINKRIKTKTAHSPAGCICRTDKETSAWGIGNDVTNEV